MKRLVMAASLLSVSMPAFAHAFLQSAIPPVGAVAATPPVEVRLAFTEDVEPAFSTITVQNSAGGDVTSGTVRAVDGATLAVALRHLAPGVYTVIWRAISVDTHRTQGRFTFTVGGSPP